MTRSASNGWYATAGTGTGVGRTSGTDDVASTTAGGVEEYCARNSYAAALGFRMGEGRLEHESPLEGGAPDSGEFVSLSVLAAISNPFRAPGDPGCRLRGLACLAIGADFAREGK